MKTFIIFIISLLGCFGCAHEFKAEETDQVWSHRIIAGFDYVITLNFESEKFIVDTTKTFEGPIFYFSFIRDSAYFRVSYTAPGTTYEGFTEKNIFTVTSTKEENGVTDCRGKVNSTNLNWREIKNVDIEVVYGNCSNDKLPFCDSVMNSVYRVLVNNKKKQ